MDITPTPTPAGWRLLMLAELPGHSHVYLLYRTDRMNPFSVRADENYFTDLTSVAFFGGATAYPNLAALTPGWQRVAMTCSDVTVSLPEHSTTVGRSIWVLTFDWTGATTAWHAFLTAQENLKPENFALVPHLLVPLVFLTRLAVYFHSPKGKELKYFKSLLVKSQSELLPLINELYRYWLARPGNPTTKPRSKHSPTRPVADTTVISPLIEWVGQTEFDKVSEATRLEPVVINLLISAGRKLWQVGAGATIPDKLPVSGLLGLALWDDHFRASLELNLAEIASPLTLEEVWSRGQYLK